MQDQTTYSTNEWEEGPFRILTHEEFEELRKDIRKSNEAARKRATSTGSEEETQPLRGPNSPPLTSTFGAVTNPTGEHQSASGQSTKTAAPHGKENWEDRTKEVPRPHTEARAGLAVLYGLFPKPVVLLPIPSGKKKPILPDWDQFTLEHTQPEQYQEMLLKAHEAGNIGALLGLSSGGLFTVNINIQEAVEELLRDIPWLEDTLRSWAEHGCQFWAYLEGGCDYPKVDVIALKRNGKKVGEIRLAGDRSRGLSQIRWNDDTGKESVFHGFHESGVRYQHNGNPNRNWPSGPA
jgi:hypothetical protein